MEQARSLSDISERYGLNDYKNTQVKFDKKQRVKKTDKELTYLDEKLNELNLKGAL